MAITRLFTHSEYTNLNGIGNLTAVSGAPSWLDQFAAGGYGYYSVSVTQEGNYRTLSSSIAQARLSMCVNVLSGAVSGDSPSMVTFGSGGVATKALEIYYDGSDWYAYAGATQLGTWADDMVGRRSWFHLAVDFKIDAASGWCYVYFDGTAKLSYSGQTNQGAANFDTICFGPNTNGQNWSAGAGWKNIYFEDSTGEGSAACPDMSLFRGMPVNGNGNYSEWVGQDADSTNNYLNVDDDNSTSNPTATYNQGTTTGDQDSYNIDDPHGSTRGYGFFTGATTILGSWLIAYAIEEAATTEQYRPFFRYSSTDSTGTAIDLTTSYALYMERFDTPPGGGSWTYAILASLEAGIEVV